MRTPFHRKSLSTLCIKPYIFFLYSFLHTTTPSISSKPLYNTTTCQYLFAISHYHTNTYTHSHNILPYHHPHTTMGKTCPQPPTNPMGAGPPAKIPKTDWLCCDCQCCHTSILFLPNGLNVRVLMELQRRNQEPAY